MDGTATGILGNRCEFIRWTETLDSVGADVSIQQYLLPTPKNKQFLESVFVSAR